jgi:hypothetical protein
LAEVQPATGPGATVGPLNPEAVTDTVTLALALPPVPVHVNV